MGSHEKGVQQTLEKVDEALGETDGPWFLGGEAPSLVDLQVRVRTFGTLG